MGARIGGDEVQGEADQQAHQDDRHAIMFGQPGGGDAGDGADGEAGEDGGAGCLLPLIGEGQFAVEVSGVGIELIHHRA